MAHVTGPIQTLPGTVRTPPKEQMCDDCGTKLATRRMQGETDSFGSEWADLCDLCYEAERARRRRNRGGRCDWCKQDSDSLTVTRDYDEGLHGSVYHVCMKCRKKQEDDLKEECDRYGW